MFEGKAERVLPRQVDPAPSLGLTVRDPIEELSEKQRGEHRRRMRRAAPSRGVEDVEVLVGKDRSP